ncbi:methylenetetrahydrofolate reductase [NAD(P)H] [Tepidiphilus thermophilus]|uniref:Methylenetetrahydrofolate reductase n=1 Tax=Tepidiphilus thermophilus TaxID=876478 RepID=A0A0K6IX42_9PROT|nr:methylenetetrahydrofolate reductase [NAD(P)H] [Tepidiphilus thermophilus]CUB07691.1 5,10-methylenetetrahydrofolate reductase (NAD(P)) [Tepidiphilus thermophilus]
MQHLELSVEFFPPQTAEGEAKLDEARQRLMQRLRPAYYSVTYGAGGSTRERTFAVVERLHRAGLDVAPHLSCIGASRAQIREILQQYQALGVRRLVALRGDLPSGVRDPGELRYASELVDFIRAETGDHFWIAVAAYPEYHPQAASALADLDAFARKMHAGADCALTQYFYNPDAYAHFVEESRRRGVTAPIVPGIMPITSFARLARFSDACGAEIPRWVRKKMEAYGDDAESVRAFGLEVLVRLCERLLQLGAPGLHFYTMNQAEPTLAIAEALGLTRCATS